MCGDGTFRLLQDDWILLTLGVLTKQYAHTNGSHRSFSSTFREVFYAVANKESHKTYSILFEGAVAGASKFAGISLTDVVKQYHCDLHLGENSAMRSAFPYAVRAADFAHLIGATCRMKLQNVGELTPPQMAWRTGIFSTAKSALQNQTWLATIRSWVFATRTVPTLAIFHTIWQAIFNDLERAGEGRCVHTLQRHYFEKLPAAVARTKFGP
jgi:hypothetical protein